MVLKVVRKNKQAFLFATALLLLTSAATAQKLRTEKFDAKTGSWLLETFPLNMTVTPGAKAAVTLSAADTSLSLLMTGSGTGTSTIDAGSQLVFDLENDSTVAAISPSIQGINFETIVSSYRHQYQLPVAALLALSRSKVKAVRKFSVGGSDVIPVDARSAEKLLAQSSVFVARLKEKNLLSSQLVPPSFPGGKKVFEAFLNRNFRLPGQLPAAGKTEAAIKLSPEGMVEDIQLNVSLGAAVDKELMRIFGRMPKWKPAVQNGKGVVHTVVQPIVFKREGDNIVLQLM